MTEPEKASGFTAIPISNEQFIEVVDVAKASGRLVLTCASDLNEHVIIFDERDKDRNLEVLWSGNASTKSKDSARTGVQQARGAARYEHLSYAGRYEGRKLHFLKPIVTDVAPVELKLGDKVALETLSGKILNSYKITNILEAADNNFADYDGLKQVA